LVFGDEPSAFAASRNKLGSEMGCSAFFFDPTADELKQRDAALVTLAGALFGNLGSLFSSFREANRDRLLAARHNTALSAFARTQLAALFPVHCVLYALACCLAVFSHFSSYQRLFSIVTQSRAHDQQITLLPKMILRIENCTDYRMAIELANAG